MDFLTSTTHLHVTAWVIGLVLFFLAAKKPTTAVHMTLRLFYIIILISGGALYWKYGMDLRADNGMMYDMKFMFGFLLIAAMEMVLVRTKKNKSTTVVWALFVIFLLLTLFYGMKLPAGFLNFFA